MPSIFSPTSTDHSLQINSSNIPLKKGNILPHFSVGEVVEVDVFGRLNSKKLIILLKGAKILADSEIPFRKGEKIIVKVKQVYPNIILHVIHDRKEIENSIADYMRLYRSNPKALYNFFITLNKEFSHKNLQRIISILGRENVENIINILRSLIISKETLDNKLFFKNYIYRFGYLLEKDVKNILDKNLNKDSYSQSLKGFMIEISDKLKVLKENKNFPELEELSKFIDSSLKTIESHQVINYLFQQYEGKYMFQIPILFPNGMGLAEIFIKSRDKSLDNRHQKNQKFLLFLLTMDALGDIVIEVKVIKKNIACILKCNNNSICNFIVPYLDKLRKKLSNLEYNVDYLKCIVEKDSLKKNEYREFKELFLKDKVDILA